MQSGEMVSLLTSLGSGVAARAGDDYIVKSVSHKDRAACYIQATTEKAKIDCLESNTLIKALGG